MRVTPRRIVAAIEASFPLIHEQDPRSLVVTPTLAPTLAMLVTLSRQLDQALSPTDPDDYTMLVASLAAMEAAVVHWQAVPSHEKLALGGLPALGGWSPVARAREILKRCPEVATLPTTAALRSIQDPDLRESLRLDLSNARRAIDIGDYKGSTVLSGSVIEALLLDRLTELSDDDRSKANATWRSETKRPSDPKASRELRPDLSSWSLHEMGSIARCAGVISNETAAAVDVARDFRNLIHPGKLRAAMPADEGTAHAALGAALRLAAELASRHHDNETT